MRIGIACHNYPPHLGGMEAIVQELACRFGRCHDVVVVSTAWAGRQGRSVEDGITVYRLPACHWFEQHGVPYALPYGPGINDALDALRACDVIHAHGALYVTTLLALVARRHQVPFFLTEHVGLVPYSSATIMAAQRTAWFTIGNYILHRAKRVITYNSRVRNAIATRVGADRVAFIPNGIDTSAFRPHTVSERHAARKRLGLPEDGLLAVFVGRDSPKKNLDTVLRFPCNGYRLVVCGAERSVPSSAINLGAVPHSMMPQVFGAADFLIHAATGEGFPVAVQEAMASGIPVALLWDPGYSGSIDRELVGAVDSLQELAGLADDLAADTSLRTERARVAREHALKCWNWEIAVDRHLRLFGDPN